MPAKKYKRRKAKKLCLIGQIVIERFWNIDRTVKSTWIKHERGSIFFKLSSFVASLQK